MLKTFVKKVHKLRIFFLVFIVFSFLTLIGLNPAELGSIIEAKVSSAFSTGSTASVAENQINRLARELKEKEDSLDQREESLRDLETRVEQKTSIFGNPAMLLMAIGIVALFILMLVNYFLDYFQQKDIKQNSKFKN